MKGNKILIVEDELIIAADIEMILESLGYKVTGIADNTEDAIKNIEQHKPDLVLLDINLESDTDGIMLAEDINNNYNIPFVYLTSSTDPLTINRVKRTNPAGFIVKPFNEKDLQSIIEIALFNKKKNTSKSEDFFIKENNSLVRINIEDLMIAKADDNYTELITQTEKHLVTSTLKKVSEKLQNDFFIRIHRSYIINVNYIDKIQDRYVIIKEHKLPIGRSYYEEFFNRISKL